MLFGFVLRIAAASMDMKPSIFDSNIQRSVNNVFDLWSYSPGVCHWFRKSVRLNFVVDYDFRGDSFQRFDSINCGSETRVFTGSTVRFSGGCGDIVSTPSSFTAEQVQSRERQLESVMAFVDAECPQDTPLPLSSVSADLFKNRVIYWGLSVSYS